MALLLLLPTRIETPETKLFDFYWTVDLFEGRILATFIGFGCLTKKVRYRFYWKGILKYSRNSQKFGRVVHPLSG